MTDNAKEAVLVWVIIATIVSLLVVVSVAQRYAQIPPLTIEASPTPTGTPLGGK